MNSVPADWSLTTLGELGRYFNGRAFKKSEWQDHGRPIIRIQNLTGSGESFNFFQGDLEDRYVARPGDLLVSWAATLGAFIWSGPEAVVNQHIFKVQSNIDVRFHKYLLDHKLQELMRHTHGSGMVHITRGRFDSLPVAIPRVEEQRRIVEILEDYLSRLDAADAYLRSSLRSLQGLRLAVLVEHRRDVLTDGARTGAIGELCETALGKMLDAKKAVGDLTPYLRNINVRWGSVDVSDVMTVRLTDSECARFSLVAGDLLVCEGGEPGRSAIWDGSDSRMTFQKALHRVRTRDSRLSPSYVAAMLEEIIRSGRADRVFTGTTIKHLPQEKLRALEIPVPDLDVQASFLARLNDLQAGASRAARNVAVGVARASALRRALLAAGFSGRLSGHPMNADSIEEIAGV